MWLFTPFSLVIVFRMFYVVAILFASNTFVFATNAIEVDLTVQEKEYTQQHPTIKVHTDENWPPFNFIQDGEVSGYNNDLIRLVADKVGLNIEFVVGYQWYEYLEKLKNKEIDVISNMKITPERQEFTIFTHYQSLTLTDGLLTREGEVFANDLSDIKSIAVIKGFFYQEVLEKSFPNIELTLTTSTEASIEQLRLGNVDAVLDAYDAINYHLQRSLEQGLVNTSLADSKVFHYLPKFMGVNKDNTILRDILDKGLLALNKKEIDNLHLKWINKPSIGKVTEEANYQNRMPILSSIQQQYLKDHDALYMCVDPDWLPIEAIKESKYVGIASEFVTLFAQRISNPIILIETATWSETVTSLKEGRCDFIPVIHKTPRRSQYLSFTSAYLDFPLALVTSENNQAYKLEQVLHKPLGMLKAGSYIEFLNTLYPDADLYEYDSLKSGLDAVSSGEIYGFIDVLPVMVNQIQTLYPELKIVDKFEHEYPFSLAVSKDNTILLGIFDKVVTSIDLQQKQKILNRWLPVVYERHETGTGYWIIISLISVALTLVCLLLYFSKKHNRQLFLKNNNLEKLAMRDYLTGLPNKHYFNEQFKKEWVRGRRSGESLSLLIIDVDSAKFFNEQYGRDAGDDCFIELARRLQHIVQRPADLLARLEADDFIILLPNTSEEGLKTLAAEIFYMVNGWGLKFDNAPAGDTVSVSIGAACMVPSHSHIEEELNRRAEQALYQAQDKGFSQLVIYKNSHDQYSEH
ncbi:transporter substrate-binding domain-containing protein [Psychromonas sp. SP041]|uniref:transporter substrate-binding domain-containing diguanylate cyclase n=1 Tax=Psychromonas sp. SP041 TaxID=1365007 RepID=UPI00042283C4|nr:transporter substrate-binding domain-containing protein [Psychromonas sp. SP041]